MNRWDAGVFWGAAFYGDVVGANGLLETRAYVLQTDFNLDAFAGAGALYQYTSSTVHSMTNIYGYALGGADWFFLKNTIPALETFSLRAQLGIGGGYTMDKNSDGTTVGKGGFLLYPSLGIDYGFRKIHANLMFGYEVIATGGTVMTAQTISAGLSYSFFDGSEK